MLREGLADRAAAPITLDIDGKTETVAPAEVGLSIDYVASVHAAGLGRSWEPEWLWNYYTGGGQLDPVITVSEMTMSDYLSALAARTGKAPRDGRIRFQGQRVVVDRAHPGKAIDLQQARDAIVAAYLQDDPTAVIELLPTAPDIEESDIQAALKTFANPAVSGAVALELGDVHVLLQPRDFAAALSLRAEDGALVPHFDQRRLVALVNAAVAGRRSPVDASIAIVDGEPKVIADRGGISFDPAAVTAAFAAAVGQQLGERDATVSVEVTEPEVTTKDVRRLKIREQVSTYTTSFGDDADRNAGIEQAMRLINGTVLQPGEGFSFNATVGPLGEGGGGFQSATTMFNAAFLAGLGDLERTTPATHASGYPVGLEATVGSSDQDLTFTNNTPYGVLIQAEFTPNAATVTMWSTAYWEVTSTRSARSNLVEPEQVVVDTDDCQPSPGQRGFDVDVTRNLHNLVDPTLDQVEVMQTTYAATDAVVCEPPTS